MLRRLGRGAMAVVYLAEDERLGRQVAVKRLHADSPESAARRFEREARLGASLNHPNLVSIFDTVTDDEGLLIVMEYVEGDTLASALKDGPLPRGEAIRVLRGVAAALDRVHELGVIHRDVKPANVLLADTGEVKLADLGIATATEATRITRTGIAVGTPSYMAPEQAETGRSTRAVDVYALAAVAFEALGGRPPVTGDSPMAVVRRAATGPRPDLRDAWPEAPDGAAEILARGLAVAPADRPATAGELVDELEAALAEPAAASRKAGGAAAPRGEERPAPPATPPPPQPARSQRRAPVAALVALVTGLAMAAAIIVLAGGGDEPGAGGAESPSAAEDGGGTPAAVAGEPAEAVQAFYQLAADGEYEQAWSLASPDLQAQLNGFEAWRQSQSTLESIEFERAETVSEGSGAAVVEFATVARHTDRVDECTGSADLVRAGDGWQLSQLSGIDCQ